ncbi:hypothetical protein GCM10027452_33950 [Micromonospora halotolerans]
MAGRPTGVQELISLSARAISAMSAAGWPAAPRLDLELDMGVLPAAGAEATCSRSYVGPPSTNQRRHCPIKDS